MNLSLYYLLCVLTGLWTDQYDQIMRWYSSKPQSGIATVLYYADYFYIILPHHPCYSSPRRSYHTSSSTHPGITCICPIISAYHTRSFAHPRASHLRPIIPTSHYVTPPPSVSYCLTLSPNILLLLYSRMTTTKVAWICFSVASWRHQDSLLRLPPS